MNSVILRSTARMVLPLFMLFSFFLFIRGHNQPGGGFVAGLMAAAAWSLYAVAFGPAAARDALWVDPRLFIAIGLLIVIISGFAGVALGQPFMTGWWGYIDLPVLGKMELGTPVLFDLGVYLAVVGVTLKIILALAEVVEE